MFKRLTSRKKQRTAVQNITENLFQNNNVFFVLTFSSVQLKYNVLALCCELCIILALLLHPISFNIFLINYLLRTPDSSNCFRFPLKVRVIGSQMNCRFLMTSADVTAAIMLVFQSNSETVAMLTYHDNPPPGC